MTDVHADTVILGGCKSWKLSSPVCPDVYCESDNRQVSPGPASAYQRSSVVGGRLQTWPDHMIVSRALRVLAIWTLVTPSLLSSALAPGRCRQAGPTHNGKRNPRNCFHNTGNPPTFALGSQRYIGQIEFAECGLGYRSKYTTSFQHKSPVWHQQILGDAPPEHIICEDVRHIYYDLYLKKHHPLRPTNQSVQKIHACRPDLAWNTSRRKVWDLGPRHNPIFEDAVPILGVKGVAEVPEPLCINMEDVRDLPHNGLEHKLEER